MFSAIENSDAQIVQITRTAKVLRMFDQASVFATHIKNIKSFRGVFSTVYPMLPTHPILLARILIL